jgi:peptide deformylase
MAVLPILTYPSDLLRRQTAPVDAVNQHIRKLVDDMVETMYEAPGVGLAANQVGQLVQLVVIDLRRPDLEHGLITLINPRIVSAEGEISFEEGCLSVPGFFAPVKRFERLTVEARDLDGKTMRLEAEDFLAVVIQHELDHLRGRLFVDRMSPTARGMFKRRWKKQRKQERP